MGNSVSRCVSNIRHTLVSCASKRQAEDEPMLSTCESEPTEKYQELDPCITPNVDSASQSPSSMMKFNDTMSSTDRRLLYTSPTTPKQSPRLGCSCRRTRGSSLPKREKSQSPKLIKSVAPSPKLCCACCKCENSCCLNELNKSKTNCPASLVDEPLLSKEYIIKTYSIQNATPSPSPATPAKFSSSGPEIRPLSCSSTSSARSSKSVSFVATSFNVQGESNSPLAALEERQDDVIRRLEQLQKSVTSLADRYHVTSTTATAVSVQGSGDQITRLPEKGSRDLVINANPSSIPLSIVILCDQLATQRSVFKSTFVHSTASEAVPDKLRQLLVTNGNSSRTNCDLVVTFMWKNVESVELMVDPTSQTKIVGEGNVCRYLARLLTPPYDAVDILKSSQIDDYIDLAQLQLTDGNSKERATFLRNLNSALGRQDFLLGCEPSLADIVCWSAIFQTDLAASVPSNVKKWVGSCKSHKMFSSASSFV